MNTELQYLHGTKGALFLRYTVLSCVALTALYCTMFSALHYTALQYTVLSCTMLAALYCTVSSAMHHTKLYCTVLSCAILTALYCTAPTAVCDTALHYITLSCTILTALCCTVSSALYYTVLYGTALYHLYCAAVQSLPLRASTRRPDILGLFMATTDQWLNSSNQTRYLSQPGPGPSK